MKETSGGHFTIKASDIGKIGENWRIWVTFAHQLQKIVIATFAEKFSKLEIS